MPNRIKWTSRKFEFNFPVDLFPEMIERFRGAAVRATAMVESYPKDILTKREGDSWSIQENIGHLLDLEPLVMGRLDEYEAGAKVLRAADMANKKTNEARHNERPMATVLADFRRERAAIVSRLEAMPSEMFARSAIHPRLNQPMRLVDLIYFSSEHDDYHLARVTELARLFATAK